MKRGKLIAGLIWLALAVGMICGLIGLIQRLMISGASFIDELGAWMVGEDESALVGEKIDERVEPTVNLNELFDADSFDAKAEVTPEPQELVQIPVEQTPEELARENE